MPLRDRAARSAYAAAQYARNADRIKERVRRRRDEKLADVNAQQSEYRNRLRREARAAAESISLPLCACGCGQRTTIISRGPGRGTPNARLKGHKQKGVGRYVNTDGYVMLRAPGNPRASRGYIAEHVLVAERALGKFLPKGAVVHHADQNKTNNSPSNLVICPSAAYHRLLHIRLASAGL